MGQVLNVRTFLIFEIWDQHGKTIKQIELSKERVVILLHHETLQIYLPSKNIIIIVIFQNSTTWFLHVYNTDREFLSAFCTNLKYVFDLFYDNPLPAFTYYYKCCKHMARNTNEKVEIMHNLLQQNVHLEISFFGIYQRKGRRN